MGEDVHETRLALVKVLKLYGEYMGAHFITLNLDNFHNIHFKKVWG